MQYYFMLFVFFTSNFENAKIYFVKFHKARSIHVGSFVLSYVKKVHLIVYVRCDWFLTHCSLKYLFHKNGVV